MDPYGADADSNLSVMSNFFEGFIQRDPAGTVHPALATSWERVDALTWRFHLRQGVKFHNGNDFTWEDVKFSFERLADPKISEFLNTGKSIANVAPVNGDPWVIDITTTTPVPWFLQNMHQIFIMDKESTESRSQGDIGQQPIGTGPYKFVEWIKGAYVTLEANEDYWGNVASIKRAELMPIVTPGTRLAAIETRQVDIMQDIPVELFSRASGDANLNVITHPSRRSIFLGLRNSSGFPASDIRIRKAMYMAINEQEIIDKIMFGHASLASQIPDPPTVGYDSSIKRFPFDLNQAKSLLKEGGFPNGFKIKFSGPNDRYVQDAQIAQALATQLAKVGINVALDIKPKAIYFPEVVAHNLDFYLLGWLDGAYDFGRLAGKLLHTVNANKGFGDFNGASYSDPELDKLLEEANATVNPSQRAKKLQELNRKAMEEKIAVIPLHYQQDSYAVVKGRGIKFMPRADGWIRFVEISVSG